MMVINIINKYKRIIGIRKLNNHAILPSYVIVSSTKSKWGSTYFHCNFVYMNKC